MCTWNKCKCDEKDDGWKKLVKILPFNILKKLGNDKTIIYIDIYFIIVVNLTFILIFSLILFDLNYFYFYIFYFKTRQWWETFVNITSTLRYRETSGKLRADETDGPESSERSARRAPPPSSLLLLIQHGCRVSSLQ